MCTCSLMPSSFSCSCSGFAPLRYGRARALVQRRRRCRRGASRARARRPSRAGRARGGASRRRTRRRSSPSANGSRSPSAWTRRYGPTRCSKNAPAAEPDQRVDDEVAGDVLAAERHEVLRGPALRRADLEHAVARRGRSGRAGAAKPCSVARPGAVLPAEVAVEERQRRVDPVVGLVPALLAGEHRPGRELAQLRVDARRGRVEQAHDAVDARVAATAGAAGERRGECPAAGGADDEARDLGGGARHAAPGRGAAWAPRLTRPAPPARPAPARPPASAGGGP